MSILFYNTKEARNHFNQIINDVAETKEEVWIMKGKNPVAKIVPVPRKLRELGLLKNEDFWVADNFDQSDSEIESLFESDL